MLAGSARELLFGMAILSTCSLLGATCGMNRSTAWPAWSQVAIDVVEGQAPGEQQHLQMVEQLGDLLRGALGALVLGGHPDFGGLLDHLLADLVHPGVQRRHGGRSRWPPGRLLLQFGAQFLERLHTRKPTVPR